MFGKTSYDCWFKKVLFNIKKKKKWMGKCLNGWVDLWMDIDRDR